MKLTTWYDSMFEMFHQSTVSQYPPPNKALGRSKMRGLESGNVSPVHCNARRVFLGVKSNKAHPPITPLFPPRSRVPGKEPLSVHDHQLRLLPTVITVVLRLRLIRDEISNLKISPSTPWQYCCRFCSLGLFYHTYMYRPLRTYAKKRWTSACLGVPPPRTHPCIT